MDLKGRLKSGVNATVSNLRDRRRKTRRRLEDIFDRQTFISVMVLVPAGKLAEVLTVPFVVGIEWWLLSLAAGLPFPNALSVSHDLLLGISWLFHLAVGVAIGVWWEQAQQAASAAADAVEDATDE